MHVRLVPVPRRMTLTGWILTGFALWGALVAIIAALSASRRDVPPVCHLHRITGIPCATCGSTRATMALLRGDILSAWLFNPLVVTLGAVAALLLILRVGFARHVQLGLSSRGRWIAWSLLAAAFIANWAYVIIWHRAAAAA